MTYNEAVERLPRDAQWSCCFGNAGYGRYSAIYRTPRGERYEIGRISEFDDWTVTELEPRVRS